ncbi:F-box/kelch-repeat protein, partial [Camellia lanceoleosa]
MRMLSLWRQQRRTSRRKKQSEGKMALIFGGRRVRKRSNSSSSNLQEGPEKSICPAIAGLMLYCVDLDGKSYKRRKLCRRISGGFRELTPLNSTSSWPSGGSMVVTLGSAVYVLGGCISNTATNIGWLLSPNVSYFETNSPQKGWISIPNMLNRRYKGVAVAVEGKIYPWATVFDPIKNKWKPLCPPPNLSSIGRDMLLMGKKIKKILIGCMFVYDVNNNTWEILPDKDEGLAFIRRSYNNLLGVGNSLYWTRLGIIH